MSAAARLVVGVGFTSLWTIHVHGRPGHRRLSFSPNCCPGALEPSSSSAEGLPKCCITGFDLR
jgi:hypothetical protein